MHMVISNAYAGDPYPVDVLFMYMANMSWNSSMNSGGVMEMLRAKDETGNYVIPKIIYSDAYSSEMVAFADLILPDTTYLERHDCISLLTGRFARQMRLQTVYAGLWCSLIAMYAAFSLSCSISVRVLACQA